MSVCSFVIKRIEKRKRKTYQSPPLLCLIKKQFVYRFFSNKYRRAAIGVFVTGFFKTAMGGFELDIGQQTKMLFTI